MNAPRLIAGRYQLADLLGEGGEARVFRAHDLRSNGEVAIRLAGMVEPGKESAPPPDFHGGWVLLLDRGFDPHEGAYQVFELLLGETLRQKVERGPLSPDEWRGFVRASFDAVEALHATGFVHGDLHADNFLQDENASWKLLELPFLRFAPFTGRTVLFGSIHTLAPEQMRGLAASAASDWYAMGCLYYYAAAGVYPHPGATSQEIAISRLRFPVIPLEEKAPALSAAWCAWVMDLLKPEPERRLLSVSRARHLLTVA